MSRPVASSRALVSIAGLLWAPWYFGMNAIGWGEPGTTAYAHYELYNRMAAVVLLLLIAATEIAVRTLGTRLRRSGRVGGHVAAAGLAVMAAGSVMEFWLFSDASYQTGSLRGWGWGTYCIGLALFYGGTLAFGLALRHLPELRPAGWLFAGWLPLAALLFGLGALTGLPLPALAPAVAASGIAYVLLGLRLPAARAAMFEPATT